MRKLLCLLGIVLAVGAFAQNYVDITIGGKFTCACVQGTTT
jgi:hypothetical protein